MFHSQPKPGKLKFVLLPMSCLLWGPFSSFLVAQTVKNLPAIRETGVRYLVWEDPPEKEMAIHSSNLAWRITWTEEPDP